METFKLERYMHRYELQYHLTHFSYASSKPCQITRILIIGNRGNKLDSKKTSPFSIKIA